MADRFQELYRLQPRLYIEGSPVIIETGALLKDTNTNKVLALIKICNLEEKIISSCKVAFRAFESNGTEREGIPSFSYLDINAGQGQVFGAKVPVYLPDIITRRISVAVTEVVFCDGSVWHGYYEEWKPIPTQETIAERFAHEELRKQYELEVGDDCAFVPVIQNGLFQCTCGTANLANAIRCYKCGRDYETLTAIMDPAYLVPKAEARLRQEEEEWEAAEAAAEEKRRRIRTILKILIPIAAVIIIIAALTPGVIKPAINNARAYHHASELLEADSYDEAQAAFEALGKYRNSADMALEAQYQKADSLAAGHRYEEAIALWSSLGTYSDSAARIKTAEEDWKEADYQNATALMEAEKYVDASKAFDALGAYKDSRDKSTECLELKKEADYQAALALMEAKEYMDASKAFDALKTYKDSSDKSAECLELKKEADYQVAVAAAAAGDYETAVDGFKALKTYKDAGDLSVSTSYTFAVQLDESGDYETAIKYYGYAKGYEDADDRKTGAIYNYACQLMDEKKYSEAVTEFNKCSGYQNADAKLLDAKYGYVTTHKNNTNSLTHLYLKNLVSAGYSGAKSLYNELYAWKVTVTAINNSPYSTNNMSSVSRYDNVCFHFKLTGGPPGETTTVKFSGHMPGCADYSDQFDYMSDGSTSVCWFYFTYGARAGTCSVTFYDGNGNVIGSASEYVY